MKVKDTELGDSVASIYENAAATASQAANYWRIFTVLVIGSTVWWAYQLDKKRGYYK
jgi:hypothetical protein